MDGYGGDTRGRARFLIEVIRSHHYGSLYHDKLSNPEISEKVSNAAGLLSKTVQANLTMAADILREEGIGFTLVKQRLAPEGDQRGNWSSYAAFYKHLQSDKEAGKFEFSMVNNVAYIHYEIMSRLKLPFAKIVDPDKALTHPDDYFVTHVHMNPRGNQALARFVGDQIHRSLGE